MADGGTVHNMAQRWSRAIVAVVATLVALVLIVPTPRADATPSPTNGPTRGGTQASDKMPGSSFAKVIAAYSTTWALGTDGVAYGWGDNTGGKWGDGSVGGNATSPVQSTMPEGITFTEMAGNAKAAAAIGSDGNIYTWGSNSYGALGAGSSNMNLVRSTPTRLTSLPMDVKFTQMAGGNWHTVALGSDGRAYSWGDNSDGQIGNGSSAQAISPAVAAMPTGIRFVQVAAGDYHSLAIDSDANVWAWGLNQQGQLGNNSTTNSSRPVKVQLPAGVKAVEVAGGWQNSAVVGSDGVIYAWGDNSEGQLGNNSTTDSWKPVPVAMPAGVSFTNVAVGQYHTVALDSNGDVWAWGNNDFGTLGTGNNQSSRKPVKVLTGKHITQVSATINYTMVTARDGTVYGWGRNITGVLGNGTGEDTTSPTTVISGAKLVSVTFGGVDGKPWSQDGDTWTATTPGGCGPVDVVVNYTLRGKQRSSRYVNGFTYATAPVITTQAKAIPGPGAGQVTVSAAAVGDNDPTLVPAVQWQGSTSGTGPWTNIAGATTATAVIPTTTAGWVRAVFTNCTATATTTALRLSTDVGIVGTKVIPPVTNGDPDLDKAAASPGNWQLTATAKGVTTPIGAGDAARLERDVSYVIGERLRTNPAPDEVVSRYQQVGSLTCTDANGAALPSGVVDATASTVTIASTSVIAEPIRCAIENQTSQISLLVKGADGTVGTPGDGWSMAATPVAPSDAPAFTLDGHAPKALARPGSYSAKVAAPHGVALTGIEALDLGKPACAAQANSAANAPQDCWIAVSGSDTATITPAVGTHNVYRLAVTSAAAMPALPLTGGLSALIFLIAGCAALALAAASRLIGSATPARRAPAAGGAKRSAPPDAPTIPGELSAPQPSSRRRTRAQLPQRGTGKE